MDNYKRETIKSGLRNLLAAVAGTMDNRAAAARVADVREVLGELAEELGGEPPVGIRAFIRNGEIDDDTSDTADLLDQAGRLLTKSYAYDIIGDVIFIGDDGELYVATVQVGVGRANPPYVKDALKESPELYDRESLDYSAPVAEVAARLGLDAEDPYSPEAWRRATRRDETTEGYDEWVKNERGRDQP